MARADDILGRNVVNPTELDASGLAGEGGIGGLAISSAPPLTESTLNIDPKSLVDSGETPGFDPGRNVPQDIDLAQPRISKAETAKAERTKANEQAAAIGGVVGTGLTEAVSVWSTVQTLKAEEQIFMDKIQRGHEDLEFNQRMIRNASNMSALNSSLNAIEQLNRQSGNVAAGGQEQLFLRSPSTGRLL